MNNVSKPKKSHVISVRLEPDLYEAISDLASDRKWSLAFTVHEILELYFPSSEPLVIDFGCLESEGGDQEVTGDE